MSEDIRGQAPGAEPLGLTDVELVHHQRRPDPSGAIMVVAFALGVVLAVLAVLAIDYAQGPMVSRKVQEDTAAELATARGELTGQTARADALDEAVDAGQRLNERLLAALASPSTSSARLTALREAVEAQGERIERIRETTTTARTTTPGPVVVVPPPTPTATARPTPRPTLTRPTPTPTPAPTPAPDCRLVQVLSVCVDQRGTTPDVRRPR